MKKSCIYCGGIHDSKEVCPKKPLTQKRIKWDTKQSQFRSKSVWTKKRDGYLRQICLKNLYDTERQYNSRGLEVHHIVPIKENEDLCLEDTNLITLCTKHHKMADSGDIPRDLLRRIARERTEEETFYC